MSKDACNLILGLVLRDEQFQKDFRTKREQLLAAFALSNDERNGFLKLDERELVKNAAELKRASRDADADSKIG